MKIFQVLSDEMQEDNKITEWQEYIAGDDIQQVFTHALSECAQYGRDLKSLREVLTVTQDIRVRNIK